MNFRLVRESEWDSDEMAEPIFEPKAFSNENKDLQVEDYKLEKEELLQYAE